MQYSIIKRRDNAFEATRDGFTLVELLVVIVVIGILVALITGAAMVAMRTVTEGVNVAEISQMATAVENYRSEKGEYPPDFTTHVFDKGAKAEVIRHLRKVFPKYPLPAKVDDAWDKFKTDLANNYPNLDLDKFDPATALVFWIGGLPADGQSNTPAGFHTDPYMPFKKGMPRTRPYYEFNTSADRLRLNSAGYRYFGKKVNQTPFVYFKARVVASTGRPDYGWISTAGTFDPSYLAFPGGNNKAVPYLDGQKTPTSTPAAEDAVRVWRAPGKFQILSPGLDNKYGDGSLFRHTLTGENFDSEGRDFNNLTSFFSGALEDELQ